MSLSYMSVDEKHLVTIGPENEKKIQHSTRIDRTTWKLMRSCKSLHSLATEPPRGLRPWHPEFIDVLIPPFSDKHTVYLQYFYFMQRVAQN